MLVSVWLMVGTPLMAQTFVARAPYLGQWAFSPGASHRPSNAIYLPGTYQFGDIDQLARYDVVANSWSVVPGLPAIKSEFGYILNINDRLFLGGGVDQPGTFSNVTWELTPPSTFTAMDNIPNGPASGFSFSTGDMGYVGGGMVAGFANLNMMFRFNPLAAPGTQWTTMTAYPGLGDINCSAAAMGGYGYVGLGRSNPGSTEYNDFWRYDPAGGPGGTWTAMAPFPGTARECGMLTPICGRLLLLGGWNAGTNAYFQDIWEFDPTVGATGAWTLLGTSPSVWGPQGGRYGPGYASYGDSLFLGMGFGVATVNTDWNLFTYCPSILHEAPFPFTLSQRGAHSVTVEWEQMFGQMGEKFIVERSEDDQHWMQIGEVPGTEQHFHDNVVMEGLHYYRLSLLASDGSSRQSEVKSILVTEAGTTLLQIAPNPASDRLHVYYTGSTREVHWQIMGLRGEQCKAGEMQEETLLSIETLARGIYFLRIEDGHGTAAMFMKQ